MGMGTLEIYPAPPPKLPSKEGSSDSDSKGKYFPKQNSKQGSDKDSWKLILVKNRLGSELFLSGWHTVIVHKSNPNSPNAVNK